MLIEVLRAKIHRIRVTDGNVDYAGSITVDAELLDRVGVAHFNKVLVANITNGNRWETYVVPGKKGDCILNGGGARMAVKGDLLTLLFWGLIETENQTAPKIVVAPD